MMLQIVPVLYPLQEELGEANVKEFVDTDEFRYYLQDGEVMYVFFLVLSGEWGPYVHQ